MSRYRYEPGRKAVLGPLLADDSERGKDRHPGEIPGAGKTTLFSILCGLSGPESGEVRIDGTPLSPANTRQWQDNLAYVSQDVFIPDMTLAENIALRKTKRRDRCRAAAAGHPGPLRSRSS